MRLIAYLRVSSNGQLDAYGPDVQLKDIKAWARHNKHKIVDVKTDDITGKADVADRPALVEALEMLRKPPAADGLVVANLTRLARELTIQEAILAHVWADGGRVFAADQGEILQDDPDDPMRTAMRQMQGVFAQLDRAMTTKRLRDGRRMKAAEGKHAVGHYAYGYTGAGRGRDRDAAPHVDEQKAVSRIVELRQAGESYRTIAAALDAEGVLTRRMSTLKAKGETPEHITGWTPMSVRSVALRAGCS
jgi:DNA invertase Pin-like site-specific DNA recombinase